MTRPASLALPTLAVLLLLCRQPTSRWRRWSAQRALELTKARRSLVAPNDGFWRTLCALEAQLGIAERWGLAAAAAAAAVVVGCVCTPWSLCVCVVENACERVAV